MVNWQNKQVLVIGIARQGMALARYLVSQGANVVVTDLRQDAELEHEKAELSRLNIGWVFGEHPIDLLDRCDLVCPSAGVPLTIPLLVEACDRHIPLSNDSQIFLEAAPCKVIGITGSAGKTTTTSLVGRMAEATIGSPRTWVGGNIGNPLIMDLHNMDAEHVAVMELSSFQLEIMTRAPQVSAVLNVTPNHLDRHVTMDAYTHSKAQILIHQTSKDIAVLGCEDPVAWSLKEFVRGELITFGKNLPSTTHSGVYLNHEMICYRNREQLQEIFSRDVIPLRGNHNLLNVLAACAIAIAAGLPIDGLEHAVRSFTGVEHRLEFVRSWGGVDWYNDSIATAPERAVAAIQSFDEPTVLLAGGRDKDLPWTEWANQVRKHVDHLILFGEAQEIIWNAININASTDRPFSTDRCVCMKDALERTLDVIEPGDVVLLSPGGTSFDEFRDFTERGDWFKKWVNNLP